MNDILQKPAAHRKPKGGLLPSVGVIFLAISLFYGCASYQLGPPQGLPFRTLHVEMVGNEAMAPQAQALLTKNLIEAFLRDGTVAIVNSDRAEAELKVIISSYGLRQAATQEEDTVLGRSFGLTLVATATLLNSGSGDFYFRDRLISADEIAYSDSGLNQAEFQAMPLLARNLAAKIKDSVLNTW